MILPNNSRPSFKGENMAKLNVPSPAVAIVGRHNSGKTTIIEKLIAELVSRGLDVGSVKHHSHAGFEVDYPGKDSFRHRAAGASETVIAAPGKMACIKTLEGEMECSEIVRSMRGHDIIVVEGYRKSGLPTIEVMRAGNEADLAVAAAFIEGARQGCSLGSDFTQISRAKAGGRKHANLVEPEELAAPAQIEELSPEEVERRERIKEKMPTADTVAIVTDIPEAREAALLFNIPALDLGDTEGLADFVQARFARPRISVVIQAGGESRRMGRSKATVPFAGRPLIMRLVDRLSPVADELIITTNEQENLQFLYDEYPNLNLKLVPDAFKFRGALPGLYTAMQASQNPYVAVVACDMIFASASLVVAQSITMSRTGADVVVPVNNHGFEPFHALYRRETCVPAIRRKLDEGDKRAQSLLSDPKLNVFEFSQDRVLEAEPRGGCFINANTPEELKRIEESYLGE